jgi:hypothetical protein
MNRTLVQRNLRSAIIIGGIAAIAFAGAFLFTAAWVG